MSSFKIFSYNIKFINGSFVQGADGIKIIIPNNERIVIKYLYHVMQLVAKPDGKYVRHWSDFKKTIINIPNINTQINYANLCDAFEEYINGASSSISLEMKNRREQYLYYLNRLF